MTKRRLADMQAARWYLDHANHGRGRLTGESRRLLKLGILTLTWTSATEWTLTLSEHGKKLLRAPTKDELGRCDRPTPSTHVGAQTGACENCAWLLVDHQTAVQS
jgi:hypothetical protein